MHKIHLWIADPFSNILFSFTNGITVISIPHKLFMLWNGQYVGNNENFFSNLFLNECRFWSEIKASSQTFNAKKILSQKTTPHTFSFHFKRMNIASQFRKLWYILCTLKLLFQPSPLPPFLFKSLQHVHMCKYKT